MKDKKNSFIDKKVILASVSHWLFLSTDICDTINLISFIVLRNNNLDT